MTLIQLDTFQNLQHQTLPTASILTFQKGNIHPKIIPINEKPDHQAMKRLDVALKQNMDILKKLSL